VDKADGDRAIGVLDKARMRAEEVGHVTDSAGIRIRYKNKKIRLK
jgi:hypothetical protein